MTSNGFRSSYIRDRPVIRPTFSGPQSTPGWTILGVGRVGFTSLKSSVKSRSSRVHFFKSSVRSRFRNSDMYPVTFAPKLVYCNGKSFYEHQIFHYPVTLLHELWSDRSRIRYRSSCLQNIGSSGRIPVELVLNHQGVRSSRIRPLKWSDRYLWPGSDSTGTHYWLWLISYI